MFNWCQGKAISRCDSNNLEVFLSHKCGMPMIVCDDCRVIEKLTVCKIILVT